MIGFLKSVYEALTFWEWVEGLATLAVLIGCIGEYLADFTDVPRNEAARVGFRKRSLILLICGLAIETLAMSRTFQISAREITHLENETAAAKKATVELQAQLQPRSLTAEQQTELVERWRPFAGHTVSMWSYAFDPEAVGICYQIWHALTTAGVKVMGGCANFMAGAPFVTGVRIQCGETDTEFAEQAYQSLKSASVEVSLEKMQSGRPPGIDFDLMIGIKPFAIPK
jgi:hypothetical protein